MERDRLDMISSINATCPTIEAIVLFVSFAGDHDCSKDGIGVGIGLPSPLFSATTARDGEGLKKPRVLQAVRVVLQDKRGHGIGVEIPLQNVFRDGKIRVANPQSDHEVGFIPQLEGVELVLDDVHDIAGNFECVFQSVGGVVAGAHVDLIHPSRPGKVVEPFEPNWANTDFFSDA